MDDLQVVFHVDPAPPLLSTHLGTHPLFRRAGAHGALLCVLVHEGTVAPVPLGVAQGEWRRVTGGLMVV